MEKLPANDDDILAQSIQHKPFRDAGVAAQEMRNVVVRSIGNGYQDLAPRSEREEPWWEGALPAWGVLGVVGSVPLAAVVPLLGLPVMISAVVAAVAYVDRYDGQKKPSFQFAEVCKEFSGATERLPEGPEKKLSREFALVAKRTFALGEIAALQARIVQGREPVETLRALQKRGFQTIDKLLKDLNYDESQCAQLKEAFRTGQLRQPREYCKLIDEEHDKLQEALLKVTRVDTFLP